MGKHDLHQWFSTSGSRFDLQYKVNEDFKNVNLEQKKGMFKAQNAKI